jgi:endonuclease/exonuclease/phosphatase family metal-dependent hydrolase
MSRWPLALLLGTALLFPLACTDSPTDSLLEPTDPFAKVEKAPGLTVMSQNLYLGANIDLLLTATKPDDFALVFDQLMTSNYGGFARAWKLAMQIVEEAPHLVGLQEVTRYTFTTQAGTQVMDFLDILQLYLASIPSPYTWTAYRHDMAATGPIALPDLPVITYTDADAILVRSDVDVIGDATKVLYDEFETLSIGPTALEMHRGYLAVTAKFDGQTVRFANTHLEVQRFEETQTAQVGQLIEELEESMVPVVLVGDFNSAANHDAAPESTSPAYRILRNAGYSDLWLRERHSVAGYTCCQGATLTNPVSMLDQRLDLILVKDGNAGFGGKSEMDIIGEELSDLFNVGPFALWPSDHAGVVATIWPAPGIFKKW